jgi:hypothetical protein
MDEDNDMSILELPTPPPTWLSSITACNYNLSVMIEILDFLRQQPSTELVKILISRAGLDLDVTQAKFPNKIFGSSTQRGQTMQRSKTALTWVEDLPHSVTSIDDEELHICEECHTSEKHIYHEEESEEVESSSNNEEAEEPARKKRKGRGGVVVASKRKKAKPKVKKDQIRECPHDECSVTRLYNNLQPSRAKTDDERVENGRAFLAMITRCRCRERHFEGLKSKASVNFHEFIKLPFEAAGNICASLVSRWWTAFDTYAKQVKAAALSQKGKPAKLARQESLDNFQKLSTLRTDYYLFSIFRSQL